LSEPDARFNLEILWLDLEGLPLFLFISFVAGKVTFFIFLDKCEFELVEDSEGLSVQNWVEDV
jgi:hypothetical protein